MSAYMVLSAQQSILASLALRFNRADVLGWVEAKPAMKLDFESEAQRLASELTVDSSDADIIKTLVQLFAETNFHSIVTHYGKEVAIEMSCTEEEIAELSKKSGEDLSLLPQLALDLYISNAINALERDSVKALIDTTSQPQYLMWFANLRYQACDFNEFDKSAFALFFNFVAGKVDIGRPEFEDCEWSLDSI